MTGDRGSEFGDGSDATRDRSDELGRREDEAGNRNVDAGDGSDGFYVGYLDETPPGVARFVRRTALGLLLLAAALGAGLALLLERFDEGVFEYGTVRDWGGALLVDPVPRLVVDGGPAGGYLLVAEGKHGLEVDVPPAFPGDPVSGAAATVAGTLIQNAEAAMIEVHSLELHEGQDSDQAAAAVGRNAGQKARAPTAATGARVDSEEATETADAGQKARAPSAYSRGENDEAAATTIPPGAGDVSLYLRGDVLVGEIVDTKCYLGAMKPGRGKPHRSCASLCIRGGIPAALLVRTETGERELIHLVDPAGRPLGPELLEWVGQPVQVVGQLRREDDRAFLEIVAFDRASTAASIRPYSNAPSGSDSSASAMPRSIDPASSSPGGSGP